jgi:hypothetical protein
MIHASSLPLPATVVNLLNSPQNEWDSWHPSFHAELLLLEASHEHRRLVSGAATRPIVRRKRKNRLVGIELNPGPTHRAPGRSPMKALTAAAAQLGSAIAKNQRKKTTKKTTRPRRIPAGSGIGTMAPEVQRVRHYRAPVTAAVGYTRGPREPVTSLPFSTSVMYLYSAAGTVSFTNTTAAAGSPAQDLHPIAVSTANGNKMFGIGIASVAQAFSRWRLKNLEVEFNSVLPTSVNGNIVLSSTYESFISGTPTYTTVASCSPSVSFPVWSPSTKLKVALDDTWCYVVTSTGSAAEQRQDYPATLLVAGVGLGGSNILCGTLRFTGTIEFTGLFDEVDLAVNGPIADYQNTIHNAYLQLAKLDVAVGKPTSHATPLPLADTSFEHISSHALPSASLPNPPLLRR